MRDAGEGEAGRFAPGKLLPALTLAPSSWTTDLCTEYQHIHICAKSEGARAQGAKATLLQPGKMKTQCCAHRPLPKQRLQAPGHSLSSRTSTKPCWQ